MDQKNTPHTQEQPPSAIARAGAFDPNSAASMLANWATQQGITHVTTTGSRRKRPIELIGFTSQQQQQAPHHLLQLVPKPPTAPQPSLPNKRRSSGINIARGQALLAAQAAEVAAEAAAVTPAAEVRHGPGDNSGRRTSKFKGVCWNKGNHRWQASINAHGRHIYLGCYVNETEAAKAYDRAALHLKGPDSEINFEAKGYYSRAGTLLIDLQTSALLDKQTEKCAAGKAAKKRGKRPDSGSRAAVAEPAQAAAVPGNSAAVDTADATVAGSSQQQQQQHASNPVQQRQQQQRRHSCSSHTPSAALQSVATGAAAAAVQHGNKGSTAPADANTAAGIGLAHDTADLAATAATACAPSATVGTAHQPMLGITAPNLGNDTILHATGLAGGVPGDSGFSPVDAGLAAARGSVSPAADLRALLAAGSRVGSSQPGLLAPADLSNLQAIADLGAGTTAGQQEDAYMPGRIAHAEVCGAVPVQPFCNSDAAGQQHLRLLLGDAWSQQQQQKQGSLFANFLQHCPQPQPQQQQGILPVQQQPATPLLQLHQQLHQKLLDSYLMQLQQQQQQELLLLQQQQRFIEQQLWEQQQQELQLQEDPGFFQLADQVAAEILSQQQPSQHVQQVPQETSATIAKLLEQHAFLNSAADTPARNLVSQQQQQQITQWSDLQLSQPGSDVSRSLRDQQLQWQQAHHTAVHSQQQQQQQPAASAQPAMEVQQQQQNAFTGVLDAMIKQELSQQQQQEVGRQLTLQRQQQQPAVSPAIGEASGAHDHIGTAATHSMSPTVLTQRLVQHSAESKRNSPAACKCPATTARAVSRSNIRGISMRWLLGQLPSGYQLEHIITGDAGMFGVLCVQQQQQQQQQHVAQMLMPQTVQLQVPLQAGLSQHSTPWMAAVWAGTVCHGVGSYATEDEARSACVCVLKC